MLTKDIVVKFIDFGVAKVMRKDNLKNTAVGAEGYTSP